MLRPLSEIRGLVDPVRQFQFDMNIEITNELMPLFQDLKPWELLNLKKIKNYFIPGKMLVLRCTSFTLPGIKLSTDTLHLGNFKRTRAIAQDRSGTWKCKIIEEQEMNIYNFFQRWFNKIHDIETGIRSPSSKYMTTILLSVTPAKGSLLGPLVGKGINKATNAIGKAGKVGKFLGDKLSQTSFSINYNLLLKGVFPTSLGSVEIDPNASKEVTLNIGFNYDYFIRTKNSHTLQVGGLGVTF